MLVLADDITGAAEMAGLAHTMGCRVAFTTSVEEVGRVSADVTVLATDTRSMGREEAVQSTRAVVAHLRMRPTMQLFKKCDSVLRGHLVAETEEVMALGYRRALVLAANPSKGRCIAEGLYCIDGVPLAETPFRHDPEFPAATSCVTKLLGADVRYITACEPLAARGIFVGESRTEEEVVQQVGRCGADTLLVGAADAFRAVLHARGFAAIAHAAFEGLGRRRTLIALGSTMRHNITAEPFFVRNRVAESLMPDAVFAGGDAAVWLAQSLAAWQGAESLLMRIPQSVEVDGTKALHLRRAMATTVAGVVAAMQPEELVIEGGASAYAILAALGWSAFKVANEIAPGVVRLYHRASGCYVTFKPGSYPWGAMYA